MAKVCTYVCANCEDTVRDDSAHEKFCRCWTCKKLHAKTCTGFLNQACAGFSLDVEKLMLARAQSKANERVRSGEDRTEEED